MPTDTWWNLPAEKRDRITHAAMVEFGNRGFSAGSLNVIAREAGVAKGSLFQYFADKFEFFAYVAEQTSLAIYAEMVPHLDGGPRPGETFLGFFQRLVDVWIDYMAAHPLERAVTAATTMELDPQVRQAVREPVHRLYAQGVRPLLEEAVAAGELSAETDVDALLSMLVLLLPHLALAPFEPGLDSALRLHGTRGRARSAAAHRLVAVVFAPHLVLAP